MFVRRLASFARVELGEEGAFAVERLDDGHAGDRFGDLRRHRGDRLAHAQERRMRLDLEPAGQDQRRRQDHERDEPEAPVEDEEAADRREQRQRVDDECRQPLREDVGERVDVRGEARDDPAGLLLREVAQRELRQVVEQILAQAEHDALADRGEAADERRLEHPGERVDQQVEQDVRASGGGCRARACPRRSRPARAGAPRPVPQPRARRRAASAATRRRWPTR